ncbi:unnamed protein product [Darwinula stevensoni]|uniref:EGF-like domain-containing protein n=1 Tax=Darwinula stevensoni TaxID=69355 RepID=A0A7R9FQ64_9CRUS|nr:unnamed protein product [Darwinula stevensoni]CAG0898903.1 unnamed protein product [Darwinula stevensoni]
MEKQTKTVMASFLNPYEYQSKYDCGFMRAKCTRTSTAYRIGYEQVTMAETITTAECCEGYAQTGDECEPICRPACVKGVCHKPNSCQCRPGYEGESCDSGTNGEPDVKMTANAKTGRNAIPFTGTASAFEDGSEGIARNPAAVGRMASIAARRVYVRMRQCATLSLGFVLALLAGLELSKTLRVHIYSGEMFWSLKEYFDGQL